MYWARVVVFGLSAISASGQIRIEPEQSRRLDIALTEAREKHSLPCEAGPSHPFLDFAFRFEVGYLVRCPLKVFGGVETPIAAYARVQAGDAAPVWFSEWYRVPGIPEDVRSHVNLARDHSDIEFSGVFAAGEGEYSVDLVVVDREHRFYHKNWKTKVYARGAETRTPISLQPNTVAALGPPHWQQNASERNLSRLTVLIDAVPVHPDSTGLRAWDRAFLIEALSSVLTELPSNSIRVAAFNLDQRQRVFEADQFDFEQARRFSRALERLELGKVSYHVLQHSQAACEMLLDLLARERETQPTADAIILLGPTNRLTDKIPSEWALQRHAAGPPLFYLKYSPNVPIRIRSPFAGMMGVHPDVSADWSTLEVGNNNGEFPDIVQHAAELHGGTTINVHSPTDLADALKRIQQKLRPASVTAGEMDR
jgi:hypothetical protein